MSNFIRSCIYQTKNSFRDLGFLFWCLTYPLILASFFYAAFSGIINQEIDNIDLGIEENNQSIYILEEIDILNIHKIDEGEAVERLKGGEIDGFVDADLNLTINRSGLNQTIVKEILEQIKQTYALNRPIDGTEFSTDYIIDREQESNPIIIVFYSLIGMVSAYGIFIGIEIPTLIQPNLSYLGNRINVTPLKKSNILLSSIISGLLINLLSNTLLILFINFVLRIQIFNEIKYSAIFIILGNLFGIALGMFISVSNKMSINGKTIIGIGTTLFLSYLSGLMGPWIKTIIDNKAPILGRANPIAVISNNLYRVNLLDSTSSVMEGIFVLLFYIMVLMAVSYMLLRRKSYDSI